MVTPTQPEVEVFLELAQELHFSRTAERLHLSQARVSRLIASLETKLGGRLFDRTSRVVRLTPLGSQLRARLTPAIGEIEAAFEEARAAARGSDGTLRLGFASTTVGEPLHRLVRRFEVANPESEVVLREVPLHDLFGALRQAEIDVLVIWQFVDEPDLTLGPVIDEQDRALAVAVGHPLASRESVGMEDLVDYELISPESFPVRLHDRMVPSQTPSGRPLRRTVRARTWAEIMAHVALGTIVHPTMAGLQSRVQRDLVTFVPIRDLPPVPLGLVWCTAHENSRIRALAQVAAPLGAEAAAG